MCTVLIMFRTHPAADLVVAANRDEFYARPATPPILLREEPFPAVGGKDLLHGGTWMGLNRAGFFSALTNIRSALDDRRSRGEIVFETLAAVTADEADEILRQRISAYEYRPFNLIYGNYDTLHVARLDETGFSIDLVEAGLHVLASNGALDDTTYPGVQRGLDLLEEANRETGLEAVKAQLIAALRDHWVPDVDKLPPHLASSPMGAQLAAQVQALCVHTEVYGTRSSNLLVVDGETSTFEATDGPPCKTAWSSFDHLLR